MPAAPGLPQLPPSLDRVAVQSSAAPGLTTAPDMPVGKHTWMNSQRGQTDTIARSALSRHLG